MGISPTWSNLQKKGFSTDRIVISSLVDCKKNASVEKAADFQLQTDERTGAVRSSDTIALLTEHQKEEEKECFHLELQRPHMELCEAADVSMSLMHQLKSEKDQCDQENATLQQECKDLKTANKMLQKANKKKNKNDGGLSVDIAMAEQCFVNLNRHSATRTDTADKCLANISKCHERILEAEHECALETKQMERLKVCICGILDTVRRSESDTRLTKKLVKVAVKNSIVLVM